jgi:hypothetical protein
LSFRESKERGRQRKCDLLFIIGTISSAKHDFSLLLTLSMKIKCFPEDLALAVGRKTRDLCQNSAELHEQMIPIVL